MIELKCIFCGNFLYLRRRKKLNENLLFSLFYCVLRDMCSFQGLHKAGCNPTEKWWDAMGLMKPSRLSFI